MRVIKIFIFFLICLSCKDVEKQNIVVKKGESQKEIQFFYKKISKDSIEVRVEYTSVLDTINASKKNERFTSLYWTREDISTDEMEDIIEKNDKQRMKEENIKGYNLEDKRSMTFNYKFVLEEENYLTVLVEDIAFLDNYNKNGDTRMIQKTFTLKERIILP